MARAQADRPAPVAADPNAAGVRRTLSLKLSPVGRQPVGGMTAERIKAVDAALRKAMAAMRDDDDDGR